MPESKKVTFKKVRGERLDKFLAQSFSDISREKLKKLIAASKVLVNGKLKKASELLKRGDEITIFFQKPKVVEAKPDSDLKIKVIKEAPDYIVVEKPADVVTHPSLTKAYKSVIEGLLNKYPEIAKVGEDKERPGIVHRLDRGTSGVMVIARTARGFDSLKKQFEERTTEKEYNALVYGNFKEKTGEIDYPITRSKSNPTMWIARPLAEVTDKNSKGKVRNAKTEYEVLKEYENFSLLRVKIHTGRTHQIRVHMKAIGHPVVGDDVYTTKEALRAKIPFELHRFFLHSTKLQFDDPATGVRVTSESGLPKILKEFLNKLS
jgi:23S rRNA pseudouridine1911/1915/1917 synthase